MTGEWYVVNSDFNAIGEEDNNPHIQDKIIK